MTSGLGVSKMRVARPYCPDSGSDRPRSAVLRATIMLAVCIISRVSSHDHNHNASPPDMAYCTAHMEELVGPCRCMGPGGPFYYSSACLRFVRIRLFAVSTLSLSHFPFHQADHNMTTT